MALGIRAEFEGSSVDDTLYYVRILEDGFVLPADKYIAAVEDDGGTIDSRGCVLNTFAAFGARTEPVDDYINAVDTAGGTVESQQCVTNTFVALGATVGPLQLTPSAAMFTLTYKPETDNIASTLAPSVCDIEFYLKGQPERDLLDDILEFQQKDYFVTIEQKQAGKASYIPYWKGVILQDQIDELDADRGLVSLRAVDGLSRLKEIKYDFGNTITDGDYEYTPIQTIIYKCLEQAMPLDLWEGTTETFLSMTVNWWTIDQTYSNILNPLFSQFFDVRAFTEIEERAEVLFEVNLTCFDVLQAFAKAYLCRVYMADGHYYFEQIPERRGGTIKRNRYNKNNTGISNGLVGVTIPINQTRESARLAGNIFSNHAALRRVIVEQESYNSEQGGTILHPLNVGTSPKFSFPSQTIKDFGLYGALVSNLPGGATAGQELTIELEFDIQVKLELLANQSYSIPGFQVLSRGYRATSFVDIDIDIFDANSADIYSWDGSDWQKNSVSTIELLLSRNSRSRATNVNTDLTLLPPNDITLRTDPMPVTGRVVVTISNYRELYYPGASFSSGVAVPSIQIERRTGRGILGTLTTKFDSNSSVRFFSVNNTNPNIGDSVDEDLGEMIIGDGALQTGHVFTKEGGSFQAGAFWNYANQTDQISLATMLCRERLGLQREVTQVYSARLFMPNGYAAAIDFDSTRWIPINFNFTAGSGIVNANYFSIERFEVSETVEQNLGLTNAQSINDEFGNFKFGKVLIEGNRVQDVFFEDDQTIMSNNLLTDKATRNPVREVEMASGENATLDADAHVVLAKWIGGNGTFQLTLPEIATEVVGQQLEIVLDENFTGSTEIQLLPQGGDTIRGEADLTISGSGNTTRFFIRATNSGWY